MSSPLQDLRAALALEDDAAGDPPGPDDEDDEIERAVARARHDPDAEVRAHALRRVVRFAREDRVPWDVVTEALAREIAPVRAMLVRELGAGAPAALRPLIVAHLDDDDPVVRTEAFEVVVGAREPGDDAILCAWLARRWPEELRLALESWSHRESRAAMVAVLAGASVEVRAAALRWFRDTRWASIGALVGTDPGLYQLARPYRAHDPDVPLEVLIDILLAHDPWDPSVVGDIVHHLHHAQTIDAALTARLVEVCAARQARIAALAEEVDHPGASTSVPDLHRMIEQTMQLALAVITAERRRSL